MTATELATPYGTDSISASVAGFPASISTARMVKREDSVPRRLGRYEVRGKIGEGGMATVYLGHVREEGGRMVALKVIKEAYSLNNEFVTMFSDEAKLVSRLSHPNIVQVFELGAEGNRLFIAMELLNGQSLWHVWNACRERGVRLRYDVAAWVGARVAEGLHHAHELRDGRGAPLNIVHRDVNASNIFITYDGRVKVIDFGLAKAANRLSKTRAGMVKGKLAYMAPEQAVGHSLDRRTDLFALGTTLWEVTADQRLFKGEDDTETLERVHAANVPDPTRLVEGYPPDLWTILKKVLQKDPQARYRDGTELAVGLDRFAMSEGRMINQSVVASIMQALFVDEKAAHDRWLNEAGQTHTVASDMPVMRPGVSVTEALMKMPDRPSQQAVAAVSASLLKAAAQAASAGASAVSGSGRPNATLVMQSSPPIPAQRASSVPPSPLSEARILTANDFLEGPFDTAPATEPLPGRATPGERAAGAGLRAVSSSPQSSWGPRFAWVLVALILCAAITAAVYIRK
jgi:eukaryotic-like serine/threonine-protein kinase